MALTDEDFDKLGSLRGMRVCCDRLVGSGLVTFG